MILLSSIEHDSRSEWSGIQPIPGMQGFSRARAQVNFANA
jgi:hypothetical protein